MALPAARRKMIPRRQRRNSANRGNFSESGDQSIRGGVVAWRAGVGTAVMRQPFFPRAMSQTAVLARTVGECREDQYPAACSGVIDCAAILPKANRAWFPAAGREEIWINLQRYYGTWAGIATCWHRPESTGSQLENLMENPSPWKPDYEASDLRQVEGLLEGICQNHRDRN